jgi:hypothetical protein
MFSSDFKRTFCIMVGIEPCVSPTSLLRLEGKITRVLRQPKTLPETVCYRVLPLENNVYILHSICFITYCRSRPSDLFATFFYRTWSARFHPEHCTHFSLSPCLLQTHRLSLIILLQLLFGQYFLRVKM